MNIIDTLKHHSIPTSKLYSVGAAVLLYAFKFESQRWLKGEIIEALSKDSDKVEDKRRNQDIAFRICSRLAWDGDINLIDKALAFELAANEFTYTRPKTVVLGPNQAQRIKKILQHENSHSQRLLKKLKHLNKNFDSLTLDEIKSIESKVVRNKDVKTYTSKFIYHKMSFIMNNYGVSLEDIQSELYSRAIYVIRRNYPAWRSPGELLAMSKSGIKSSGHNFILHYASAKRAKIDRSNLMRETSIEGVAAASDISTVQDRFEFSNLIFAEVEITDSGTCNFDSKTDNKIIVNQLLTSKNLAKGQRYFLSLLVGRHCDSFSAYLGVNNAEYADEKPFETTLSKASSFVGISLEEATTFLNSLK